MVQSVENDTEIDEAKGFLEELSEGDSNSWIVTFADLVTLLLVFFIMLYTMSSIDLLKFKEMSRSMRHTFGTVGAEKILHINVPEETEEEEHETIRQVRRVTMTSTDEERMVHEINKAIKKRKMQGNIISYLKGGKAIIHIRGKVLFESGVGQLNKGAEPVLDELIEIIKENPYFQVNIKGHTDNIPISTPEFPSNWELSAIRATTVLKYLVARGFSAKRLTATGYGDVMPLFPNNTAANRAKNRRIEFVLEKKERN